MLFNSVISYSGGLYGCSPGFDNVQGVYMPFNVMMKKIIMEIVATNAVAGRRPEW